MARTGPKSGYRDDMPDRVYRLCLLGLRDQDLATAFGVHVNTIYYWKEQQPLFAEAILQGRQVADSQVAEALFKRAIGYSHPDTYITTAYNKEKKQTEILTKEITKHYPPDSWAAFKWLSIRQRDYWMDVQKVEHSIKGQITHKLSDALTESPDISEEELELALKVGMIKAKKELPINTN